jgi:hypothetical protein
MRGHDNDNDDGDDQRRILVNFAGLVFVVLLLVGSIWVAKLLSQHAKLEDCLMSGRTNCAPINVQR